MQSLKGNTSEKIFICIAVILLIYACRKPAPFDNATEEQFVTRYCNDPIAINFNHGFPGTADNSICIYPTDVFTGTYMLKDSIFNGEFALDTVLDYTITFHPVSHTKLKISGFCVNGDTIRMTADRYYKAAVDSMMLPDSNLIEGHVFCRAIDTISGTINKYKTDNNKIRINFIIASDTGINYHIGTGVKM